MSERIDTYAALLEVTGGAPVVRFEVPAWERPWAWRHGRATAFVRASQGGGRDLVGLGPADDLRVLFAELLADGPRSPMTGGASTTSVEQVNREALMRVARPLDHGGWYLMSARRCDLRPARRAAVPGSLRVSWPKASEPRVAAELTEFLDAHHTSHWTRPGAMGGVDAARRPRSEQWVVLRDATEDAIVAIGCVAPTAAGIPRIAGVAVDAARRGHGLGTAITLLLAGRAHEADDVVELGVDHDHPGARRLYGRLGFRVNHAWWSERIGRR